MYNIIVAGYQSTMHRGHSQDPSFWSAVQCHIESVHTEQSLISFKRVQAVSAIKHILHILINDTQFYLHDSALLHA